jgi:YidC/Oxa1 family membrane protein insertase
VHQKYLTPPSTATLTPEQEQQQRMIKIMSVVMFPVFMYNAPSGLSLYFITNSALAIVESKLIRRHAEKHGLLDVRRPARPASGARSAPRRGILARLQQAAEERQKQAQRRARGPGGRRQD